MKTLRLQILASGSKGNAYLVWSDNTCILVEAGLSLKALKEKIGKSPVDLSSIRAVLISHEHNDHVKGLGVLSRTCNLEVYMTEGTMRALPKNLGEIRNRRIFFRGRPFTIGDIEVLPFALPHDAADPAGFVISKDSTKIALCTDLGAPTALVKNHLLGCHALVVEANHELERLLEGPYPWHLKQRIRSRLGHLSNDQAVALCEEVYHYDLHCLCFAHLSEVNNSRELVEKRISKLAKDPKWSSTRFFIADQYEPAPPIEL